MKAGNRYRNWCLGYLSYGKKMEQELQLKIPARQTWARLWLLLGDSLDTCARVRARCSSLPRKMRFSLPACEPSVPLASAWRVPASCSHCLACHLAASALQTQLESLSQSPAFWFFCQGSVDFALTLLFYLVPNLQCWLTGTLILALFLTSFSSSSQFCQASASLTFVQAFSFAWC